MHAFIQSQRDDQSFGDMRWGKWSMDSYTSRPVARWAKNRLNSAAAPHIEFKESLEEILSFMVFAQIQTCISFHEVGHACACGRSRVHVSTHRAVSVAPLAESYLVFSATECCMCHGEVRSRLSLCHCLDLHRPRLRLRLQRLCVFLGLHIRPKLLIHKVQLTCCTC